MKEFAELQTVRVTNEYKETHDWTIIAINPTSGGNLRLTLERPHHEPGMPTFRANAYTGDPETKITVLSDATAEEPREERRPKVAESPKRRPIQNDCLGLSWSRIESMQGGRLAR